MSDLNMRPFVQSDQVAVYELINAGLAQRFGESYDPQYNSDLNNIYNEYITAGGSVIVLEEENEIVGCGMLIHENGSLEIGRIVRVSVRADQQGRGFGRLISEYLINLGRERGFKEILVETNSDWTSALYLYKTCGFTEYARTYEPDFDFTEVHMRLIL